MNSSRGDPALDSWETDFPQDPRPHFLEGGSSSIRAAVEPRAKRSTGGPRSRRAGLRPRGVLPCSEIAFDSGDAETAAAPLPPLRWGGSDVPAAARLGKRPRLRHLERFSKRSRSSSPIESQDREATAQQLVELGQTRGVGGGGV